MNGGPDRGEAGTRPRHLMTGGAREVEGRERQTTRGEEERPDPVEASCLKPAIISELSGQTMSASETKKKVCK